MYMKALDQPEGSKERKSMNPPKSLVQNAWAISSLVQGRHSVIQKKKIRIVRSGLDGCERDSVPTDKMLDFRGFKAVTTCMECSCIFRYIMLCSPMKINRRFAAPEKKNKCSGPSPDYTTLQPRSMNSEQNTITLQLFDAIHGLIWAKIFHFQKLPFALIQAAGCC